MAFSVTTIFYHTVYASTKASFNSETTRNLEKKKKKKTTTCDYTLINQCLDIVQTILPTILEQIV